MDLCDIQMNKEKVWKGSVNMILKACVRVS